jgi:hypothetical protein
VDNLDGNHEMEDLNEKAIGSELNDLSHLSLDIGNSHDTIIDGKESAIIDFQKSPISDTAPAMELVNAEQTPRRPSGLLGSVDVDEDGLVKGRKYYNLIKRNYEQFKISIS